MIFTEAKMPGEDDSRSGQAGRITLSKEDDNNGCRQKNQCQNDANQGQMNLGQMNPGQMHSGQMFPGRMYPGLMNPCQMNPGQMYPCQMNSGQMNPGQMNLGQINPGQMNLGQMNPCQMNPGQMNPVQQNPCQMPGVKSYGQTFPFSNSAQQPRVGRPSTYDTLSMDVSKQVVRQLTPLAHVGMYSIFLLKYYIPIRILS